MTITSRQPLLSSVLMQDAFNVVENINYAAAPIGSAADSTMEIGSVVIWDTDHFRLIANADVATIAATATSSLPNGAEVGVVVGFDSLGDEYSLDLVGAAYVNGVILFRGMASVKGAGLKTAVDVTAPNLAIIKKQLEKQNIAVKAASVSVASTHYGF